jgi:hypothetical protein
MNNPSLKSGDKFGKLTIVSWDSKRKEYICKCDCGNLTHARSWSLKTGRHKACKCGMRDARIKARLPNHEGIKRELYRAYRQSSLKRGKEFFISYEQFIELIGKSCFYCGIEPKQRWKVSTTRMIQCEFVYNGIDRKNNDIGYVIDNCVPCCEQCNNSKKTLSYENWMVWLKRISDYQFKNK